MQERKKSAENTVIEQSFLSLYSFQSSYLVASSWLCD